MKLLLISLLLATSAFAQHRGRVFVYRPHVFAVSPGYYGYYGAPYFYGPSSVVVPPACKKEKLKDSTGKKHELLVCRQPDGSFKVVANADQLK